MRGRRASRWLPGGIGLLLSSGALAAAFPGLLRIPRINPVVTTPAPASFSHRVHQVSGCYACHPSVFPQAPLGFTHEQMQEGRFCGRCHDGRTAFSIAGAVCGRCHVEGR